jgi:hypothetical protein
MRLWNRGLPTAALGGILFSLVIKPLLQRRITTLRHHELPVTIPNKRTLVTGAYANDITVFLTKEGEFSHLLHTSMINGVMSTANLNVYSQ